MGVQLYIHVPFCRRKCGYCAFYSLPSREHAGTYLQKLIRQLNEFTSPDEIDSVYLGGGTPTILRETELIQLFEAVRRQPLKPDAEITIEGNPETFTPEKMDIIRKNVTRISVGIQSFDAAVRETLGRECSDRAISNALQLVKERQFPHFNCDLMYAVPGQTGESWHKDLKLAADSGADHISCYSLTPEEGTLLVRGGLTNIDEDMSAQMWHDAGDILGQYGFDRYEISNYAKPGAQCRHNTAVWQGSRLFGFGPAASSYDGAMRYTQQSDLHRWLNNASPETDYLPPEARRREIAVINLRTVSGWSKSKYLSLPGASEAEWKNLLNEAEKLRQIRPELIYLTPDELKLTESGLLFWDTIACELLMGE